MYKKFEENDITTLVGEVSEEIVIRRPFYYPNIWTENHYVSRDFATPCSYFLSVYDGVTQVSPPDSNKLLSLTVGIHTSSGFFTASTADSIQKNMMYKLYAKSLLGNKDSIFLINNAEAKDLVFLSLSRNQIKDGIKKNTSNIGFLSNDELQPVNSTASVSYFSDFITKKVYSYKGGEAGDLFAVSRKMTTVDNSLLRSSSVGLVFYDHGTFVFKCNSVINPAHILVLGEGLDYNSAMNQNYYEAASINAISQGIINKLADISFSNISRPRISIFNCTLEKEEFNYSSNPTYKNKAGEIITNSGSSKSGATPTTYVTQVGLVNELGQILAVGKLTQPVKKDPTKKAKINVRLIQ